MTFNTGLKSKMYAAETQLCRKTALGPTFAGAIDGMAVIQIPGDSRYFVFKTDNVIGVGKLPIDGNPYRYAGIIGHATPVSHLALVPNASTLLSAGGEDGVVKLWGVNVNVIDNQMLQGGEGMTPFLQMLDPVGGKGGEIYKEFEDYFFYAQIKMYG